MNRVATPGYLRFPHIHGDLLAFVAEDDVWLAPADGGRAWRLTSDGGQASHPRFSPDGATIAWTSWRDGGIPEVYTADIDGGTGGPATRRTYWGDMRTRTTGWTDARRGARHHRRRPAVRPAHHGPRGAARRAAPPPCRSARSTTSR